MELIVVGCSGSVSGPESPASSYLVQAPYEGRTFTLLLDLGPGSFGHLYRYVDPASVDAIGLSHLHPDHCLDLCAFHVAARYSGPAAWRRVPLYGPAAAQERLTRAYDVSPGGDGEPGAGLDRTFAFHIWAAEQRIGPFVVRTAQVEHPVEAYAIRVEEDTAERGSLTFSGDTGPCAALTELATGTDLLLAESAYLENPDNAPGLHLTPRDAAEAATRAGAGALVLTHIPPWHDRDEVLRQARPHASVPVQLASPGSRWTIGGTRRR